MNTKELVVNFSARRLALGTVLVAMGMAIFFAEQGPWKFRGLLYAAVGGIAIYRAAKRLAHA